MKKIIYNVFLGIGVIVSAFGFSKQTVNNASAVISDNDEATFSSAAKPIYFSDILDNQMEQQNLIAYHYSHRSHGSHYSHRSHSSHYSGF